MNVTAMIHTGRQTGELWPLNQINSSNLKLIVNKINETTYAKEIK